MFRSVSEEPRSKTIDEPLRLTSVTIGELFHQGSALLKSAGIENADNEAVWLLEAVLGPLRLALLLDPGRSVTPAGRRRVQELFRRRAAREPLQYILGTQEFCGLEFLVGPAVLIPRPESELLVEEAVSRCARLYAPLIADMGTGSGCLAVSLARALPTAIIFAVDCSSEALGLARENAARHGVQERIQFLEGDLFVPLHAERLEGRIAAIVSNPPYLAADEFEKLQPEVRLYEPHLALDGGADGLMVHRRLLHHSQEFLMAGGMLLLEAGCGQASCIREMGEAYGYRHILTRRDAAGIERVVCFEKR